MKCIYNSDICEQTEPAYSLFLNNLTAKCVCIDPGNCNVGKPPGTVDKYWDVNTCSCRYEFSYSVCSDE